MKSIRNEYIITKTPNTHIEETCDALTNRRKTKLLDIHD